MKEKIYTIVTGSSSGIGKAIAIECAKRKYNLILIALPDTGLKSVSNHIQHNYKVDVKYYEINLTEKGAGNKILQWVNVQDLKIDKLINNAGIGDSSYFETTDLNYYLEMMHINSQSVVSLTSTFIPKLKEHEQSYILNMGSFAGLMPVPYKSVYSATKSFVVAFSQALRMELKQFGIHVSCICPGPTSTESVMARHERIGNSSKWLMMTPEEVAGLAIEGMLKQKGLIVPGWKNRFILGFSKVAPYVLKHYLLNKIFEKSVEKTTTYSIKPATEIAQPVHERN